MFPKRSLQFINTKVFGSLKYENITLVDLKIESDLQLFKTEEESLKNYHI